MTRAAKANNPQLREKRGSVIEIQRLINRAFYFPVLISHAVPTLCVKIGIKKESLPLYCTLEKGFRCLHEARMNKKRREPGGAGKGPLPLGRHTDPAGFRRSTPRDTRKIRQWGPQKKKKNS